MSSEREWRTAHWGTCSNQDCLCSMIIYPHPDRPTDLPDPDDDADEDQWATSPFFIDCPVCDSSMDWGGTDHPADLLRSYR